MLIINIFVVAVEMKGVVMEKKELLSGKSKI